MTREEELALLIEEQRKDDTHVQQPQYFGRHWVTSLDSAAGTHDDEKWDWLVGLEHEENVPGAPAEIRTRHYFRPDGRHGSDRGGVLIQIPHGTDNGYNNYRCRCPECRAANTRVVGPRVQAYRERKQNERPKQRCANERCQKTFRPIPSTKKYCSHRCADAMRKRNKRATDEAFRLAENARRREMARAA